VAARLAPPLPTASPPAPPAAPGAMPPGSTWHLCTRPRAAAGRRLALVLGDTACSPTHGVRLP
jgi:hypothetical protein